MQKHFLIGIGGTGSRVLEAFVHCCASGFGPKGDVYMMLIDPDNGNGNLTKTKTLIKNYQRLKKAYKPEPENTAFQTNIIIPEPFVWSIFEESDQTLAKYIGYENLKSKDQGLAAVADLLFTKLELETALNEGFRGHPSIGAVVMADPPMDKYPFKMLKDEMPQEAGSARVFLVGSIFGGTGAAGFPTLGADAVLKYNAELQTALGPNRSKVMLGGALVLPYFSFKVDNSKSEKMFVTPQDFPAATKAALHYYNDKQLAFDQYYFIGDSLSQDVGEFSTGTSTQNNRPHYVELASALAAFDFFRQPTPKDDAEKSYFIASRETKQITWDELPLTRESDRLPELRNHLRTCITEFSLFCYTYLTLGEKFLKEPYNELKKRSWYRDSFKNFSEDSARHNPSHGNNKDLHNQINEYATLFLKWITDLDDGDKVRLINSEMLLESKESDQDDERKRLQLRDPETHQANIGRLLRDKKEGKSYLDYYAILNDRSVIADETQHAADKYLNIFFRAAREFNKDNTALR